MKNLVEKFKKFSAVQLIEKLKKGQITEDDKNVIITLLKGRGRDVQNFEGKTLEEIRADFEEDAKMEQESETPKAEKTKKEPKAKKESTGEKKKEIYIESEEFPVGSEVKINNSSKAVPEGTVGTVKKVGHYEGEQDLFAYIIVTVGERKFTCSRMVRFIEPVKTKKVVNEEVDA